jgi:preprotein translocase subunit YajC
VNQQLILLLVVMAALFYLLIYRPQARAKRQREELDRSLEVGREVVTIGGLHGEIVAIDAETADVEIADGVVVTFERRAISATARPQGEDEDLDEDDEDLDDLEEDEALGDEADEIDPEAVADAAHGDEGASSDGDAGRPA